MALVRYPSIHQDCAWLTLDFTALGDTYASTGMNEFGNLIKGIHPGIFIHSIYIDEDVKEDQRAGFVRANIPSVVTYH